MHFGLPRCNGRRVDDSDMPQQRWQRRGPNHHPRALLLRHMDAQPGGQPRGIRAGCQHHDIAANVAGRSFDGLDATLPCQNITRRLRVVTDINVPLRQPVQTGFDHELRLHLSLVFAVGGSHHGANLETGLHGRQFGPAQQAHGITPGLHPVHMGLQLSRGIRIRYPGHLAAPAQSETRAITVPGQFRGKPRPHVLRPAVQVMVVEGKFGVGVDHGEAVAGGSAAGIRLVDEGYRESPFADAPGNARAQNTGSHDHNVTGRFAAGCHRIHSNCAGSTAGRVGHRILIAFHHSILKRDQGIACSFAAQLRRGTGTEQDFKSRLSTTAPTPRGRGLRSQTGAAPKLRWELMTYSPPGIRGSQS